MGGGVDPVLFGLRIGEGSPLHGRKLRDSGLSATLGLTVLAVRRGEEVRVDVVVRTRGVGHFFPGGTVDAFDVWLELKAVDENGNDIAGLPDQTDTDPSNHFGALPGVDIEKATNGEDADEPTGPEVRVGDEVTWTFVVTNTGDITVPLSSITVTDSIAGVNPVFVPASDDGDELLATELVQLTENAAMTTAAISLDLRDPGYHRLQFSIAGPDDEQ